MLAGRENSFLFPWEAPGLPVFIVLARPDRIHNNDAKPKYCELGELGARAIINMRERERSSSLSGGGGAS